MSATISPTPEGGGMISPVLSVEFMVNMDRLDDIAAKAAEIDDGNNGEHLAVYTIEQALLVIFHSEPEWLFTNRKPRSRGPGMDLPLGGWVVQTDVGWNNDTETHEEGQ